MYVWVMWQSVARWCLLSDLVTLQNMSHVLTLEVMQDLDAWYCDAIVLVDLVPGPRVAPSTFWAELQMFRTDAATGERPGLVKKLRATPQTWNIPHAVRCSSILAMSCHDVKESHEASLGMLTSKWKSFSHKVWEWPDTSTVPPDP